MNRNYFLLSMFIILTIVGKTQSFIRVYNSTGNKIARGVVLGKSCTDSTLVIERNNFIRTISIRQVSYIKTKHSIGNNILVGSFIGGTTIAIIGALGASSSSCSDCILEYTTAEGAAAGFIVGVPVGAAIGAITGAFKNSKTVMINGNVETWRKVRAEL